MSTQCPSNLSAVAARLGRLVLARHFWQSSRSGRSGRGEGTLAGIVRYGSYIPYYRLQRAAMARDVSWEGCARHYLALYRTMLGTKE